MRRNLMTVLVPLVLVLAFALGHILVPDNNYSNSERRVLAKQPVVTVSNLISGEFMESTETYALDQFPMRDTFRKLKAGWNRFVYRQGDNNGLYMAKGYISKLEYPLNEKRVKRSLSQQKKVFEKYIDGTDCSVYFSIVPDKNYFLAEDNGYPVMDYNKYVSMVCEGIDYGEYIDIFDTLSLDSYYHTDQHWKQECIIPVAERLAEKMGLDLALDGLKSCTLETPFYGAYYYQLALPADADVINYMVDTSMSQWVLTSYDRGTAKPAELYNLKKSSEKDAYDLFMSGPDALMVMDNPNGPSDKELIIFRDSFASSLVPLIASGYSKVTLVDLRYINVELLGDYVNFSNQDVLFMYSSLIF